MWYGRDEGLPEDRLGRDISQLDVLTETLPQAEMAEAREPVLAAATTPVQIAPTEPATQPVAAAAVVPATPVVPDEVIAEVVAAPEMAALYVSGSRVNMRAGPGTSYGVITALSRGTMVEDLGPAGNGWTQIRVADTGERGYMSSQFLTDQQP